MYAFNQNLKNHLYVFNLSNMHALVRLDTLVSPSNNNHV